MISDSQPNEPESPVGAATVADRCLLYLLGEMSDPEIRAFESELRQSQDLRSTLAVQAQWITAVSTTTPVDTTESAIPVLNTDPAPWHLPVAGALLALAASVIMAIVFWPSRTGSHPSKAEKPAAESVLIAHAWAESSLSILPVEDNGELRDEIEENESFETLTAGDQTVVDDASLSWMVAGVKAETSSDG